MAAYIAIFLSSICIILLITVIVKFKKLFSTESIIEKTKVQMNKIISDINKNANMDIDLINEATRRSRNLIKDMDSKVEEFKEATDILRDMIATVEAGTNRSFDKNPVYRKNNLVDDIKPIGKMRSEKIQNESFDSAAEMQRKYTSRGSVAAAYKVNDYTSHQQSLFEEDSSSSSNLKKNNNKNEILEEKNNHNSGPNIITNIIPSERVNTKKSLNDKVEKLFNSGMQVEDIAVELSCSISEVQFIIDMLNERS